jgi:gamma-glutamyltranspeptidase/glutathione hydrolase
MTARMHHRPITRREMLCRATGGLASSLYVPRLLAGAEARAFPHGIVIGEPTGEMVGAQVLANGGNAVDAIVAAALAAAVAAPHQTGIGGYAAHGVLAVENGKTIVALDANTTAPAALRDDTFQPDANGQVPGRINEFGWLAAGVPGILAGLQLALDRFGTRSFRELVQPAIRIAREGFPWPASLANIIRTSAAQFEQDPGSRRLYFRDGKPIAAGVHFQNPELADMLSGLARAGSVEPFYRGEIAQRIAEAFRRNGGLVTAEDLATYRARLVEPLALRWGPHIIHTAPLTAGGLTMLQAVKTLQVMGWNKLPPGLERTQKRIEALRLAWRDRLTLLGDPESVAVPQAKLLSEDYARECAAKIEDAVKAGKLLSHAVTPRDHRGTIHLSAADGQGNFAALTLTHGNSFGARVTVDGLGLTLGHGMSRFDPHPDHPNAPGPGKRPLHNMVPTIVTTNGCAVLAAGGRGGRKIPNAMFELLTRYVALGESLEAAIAAPRMHTEGGAALEFEKAWLLDETTALARLGYSIKTGSSATLSAVAVQDGVMRAAMR